MTVVGGGTSEALTARQLHRPAGSLTEGLWSLSLSAARAGWRWASLRAVALGAGASVDLTTGQEEMLVLPLEGSCTVRCDQAEQVLDGRAGTFAGPTDFAYLPPGVPVSVTSTLGGRFALPGAPAQARLPFRYQPASAAPVELRGAGNCSRKVVNYCMPGSFEADRLMVCEVFTPSGNWSSYPPHKHDQEHSDEAQLEEIYYFEIAPGPSGQRGFGYQRIYSGGDRPVDLLAEVGSGDVVLVPYGYHGPSMAAPGYDMYYLNVMAGPGPWAWLAADDPVHAWARSTWDGQAIDPRLLDGACEAGAGDGAP